MSSCACQHLFIFDFDSTLVEIESLDELLIEGLQRKGKKELIPKIEEITNMGMNGEINLSESIRQRLDLAKLHQDDIKRFQKTIVDTITPGLPEIIEWLQSQGHIIYIISGGFLDCILPVAEKLAIPVENCFANTYHCNKEGYVTAVDPDNPLIHSNGKCQTINRLIKQNDCPVVIVGDGYSDLIPWKNGKADYFLGFGINVSRPKIKMEAKHYFTDIEGFQAFVKAKF